MSSGWPINRGSAWAAAVAVSGGLTRTGISSTRGVAAAAAAATAGRTVARWGSGARLGFLTRAWTVLARQTFAWKSITSGSPEGARRHHVFGSER
ncbi:hypothetical protein [Herbidospora cretacea]|uniref:hypothetical protein n=1 Tax=Herbidospora cretacea TaxID=28444 RepID=UPI0012FC89EC|nr:hypothetical protein [Herbidospora cretacea]